MILWIAEDLALLQVDIADILCDVRTWQHELDEICVWGDIGPERIELVKKK